MPLTRDQLIDLAITQYFVGCNDHDREKVVNTFADNCVMRFSSAKYQYVGVEALGSHFDDFLSTFKIVNFHNFSNVVDVENQSIASEFTVQLVDHQGEELVMTNCNFFKAGKSGLFDNIMIYNSAPLQKGFEAGSL